MSRLRAALPLLLLIATGIVLAVSGVFDGLHPTQVAAHPEQLRAAVASSPWVTRLGYVGMLTLVVATGMPAVLLVVLTGGLLFGVLQGAALSLCGLVLGSLLLFLASRYAFGSGQRTAPALVEHLREGFARYPASYTFFLRFVPVFPYGGVTMALAWLRCPLHLFLLATAVGSGIMLIFETALGAGLGDAAGQLSRHGISALAQPELLLPLGALALLSLAPLLFRRRPR